MALAGCSDVKGPEVEPAPSFSQQEDQGRAASPPEGDGGTVKVADMAARKWFRISINATPTLRPDALIGVTVTYTANFATDDADLFVTLPEVEAAEGSGWDERYRKPVGTQRPVKAESNHSLVAGGRVTHSISFKVPVAGIYRVHATARSNKTAPDETSDRTQQSAYKTLWLLVDESGGRTLDAEWGTSGYADSNGEFEVACPGSNDDFEGSLSFDDGKVKIVPRTKHALTLGYCGRKQQFELPSVEGRTWLNAYYSIPNSRAMFYSRAKITVRVEESSARCGYLLGKDLIRIVDNDQWGCVWEKYGMFVFPHEYGHALHATRLGGLPDRGSCSIHGPDLPTNLGCAYVEGWGDYHGFITQPTIYAGRLPGTALFTRAKIENNSYLQKGEDGSIDEGVVAAFFYDLVDPAGETGDRIDLTGTDVSRVMNGCRVHVGRTWSRPRGIDDLIWCLEAAVDADITGDADYFPTRTNDATKENQSNHAWNEDHIRTLWLKNLYGEKG